jgi:hypothetical protein
MMMGRMTTRERFLAVLNFQPVDRLPLVEWAAWWDETIRRWQNEGLPAELDWEGQLRHFGLDVMGMVAAWPCGPDCPGPAHHGAGLITDEASYEKLLPHLYPDSSIEALVRSAKAEQARHERGEIILRMWLDGFFWWPRTLFGIENHLFAFYDHPDLMKRINADLVAFHRKALDAVFQVIQPDLVGFAEDMSYNNGPMLSKEIFDEFLLPCYRQLVPLIQARGVKALVDTDGQLESMIPWLEEAGFDGVYPLERQSGVDVARIRANHPRFIMMGGFDKMVMNKGEAAIRAEFDRLLPVMKTGGYVPSVDHQTPPGVSYQDYQIYARLFREYALRAAEEQCEARR